MEVPYLLQNISEFVGEEPSPRHSLALNAGNVSVSSDGLPLIEASDARYSEAFLRRR